VYTNMTSKGQVTIPKRVRDFLGLKAGAKIGFELADDGRVVMVGAKDSVRRQEMTRLRGSLKSGMTTDEIMALTRGDK
jgi:antitoxin PrlF